MVMTRSGGSSRRRLVKGSSSNKGNIFDKKELAMDPIDVEPLSFAPPTLLVPYGTSEDEVLAAYAPSPTENSPIESQKAESSNLGDNPVQTLLETLVPNIKIKVDPSEDSFVEKHDSQGTNLDDTIVRTALETTPGIGREDQPIPLQWVGWVTLLLRFQNLRPSYVVNWLMKVQTQNGATHKRKEILPLLNICRSLLL